MNILGGTWGREGGREGGEDLPFLTKAWHSSRVMFSLNASSTCP